MMRWMVLGASPSAPEYVRDPDVDMVGAAGDAITLRRPDYYFINELRSLGRYEAERRRARAAGTKVLVKKKLERHIAGEVPPGARRKCAVTYDFPMDGWIETDNDYEHGWKNWQPGSFCATTAGGLALQWAVNHGATEVHLVGMEGYTGGVDYFTGESGNAEGAKFTVGAYGPFIQRVVEQCPHIMFFLYGAMTYPVSGENVIGVSR